MSHRVKLSEAERSHIISLYRTLKYTYRELSALVNRSVGSISAVVYKAKAKGELPIEVRIYNRDNECECSSPLERTYRIGKGKGCAECERKNDVHFRGVRSARSENARRQVTVWQSWGELT